MTLHTVRGKSMFQGRFQQRWYTSYYALALLRKKAFVVLVLLKARSITWAYNTPFWWMMVAARGERSYKVGISTKLNIMMGTIWKIATQGRHIAGEVQQFHLSWIQFTLLYTAAENPVQCAIGRKTLCSSAFFLCVHITKQSTGFENPLKSLIFTTLRAKRAMFIF